jgi:hypothetical protein
MRAWPATLVGFCVLVAGARPTSAHEAASHADHPPEPAGFGPMAFSYTGFPIGLGVSRFVEIDELNTSLRRAGYRELDPIMPTLSAALTVGYAFGLVIEPTYRFIIADAGESTLTVHQLLLDVGWMIAAQGDLTLIPMLGFGYGNASLDVSLPEDPASPDRAFDEVLLAPAGEVLMSSSSFLLHAGFASTIWGSGHGDFVGLRTGFVWAPVSSGWKRGGEAIAGGPVTPMSAAYIAVTLGVHSPRWR